MRGKSIGQAWLLVVGWLVAVGAAHPQNYAPPDPEFPAPVGNTNPSAGGPFTYGGYVMYRQSNPIGGQTLAVRGFQTSDDTVLGLTTSGTFVGSRSEALNVSQVGGPNSYSPGFLIGLGYQFNDGSSVTVDYLHLLSNSTRAAATPVPAGLRVGSNFSESYLTAFVYNFPNQYAGNAFNINLGGPYATYGIWNAASIMEIKYEQRAQQFQILYREPIFEDENYRVSGIVGGRFFWIWDRFWWRTVNQDLNGFAAPTDVAIYTNIVSNRMYGLYAACRTECYLGDGFALQLDLGGSLFLNSVKERAKYELGAKHVPPANKRSRRVFTFAPEVEAKTSIVWFPTDGIQIFAGYDFLAFFNTIASPEPVSFDYGAVDPKFKKVIRLFDGIRAGVLLSF
jgi:hypothetical protein